VKSAQVLILGGGVAGLTAAIYAARAGAKTLVIENLVAGGSVNLTPDIANFPGFLEISGAELGEKVAEQAIHAGAEIVYDETKSVDIKKQIVVGEEDTYQFEKLIIATGASPRRLGLPEEEAFIGNGIHFCGLCDGQFYKGKDIVVVGGGNHAVEEAIYLEPIAKSVTLINNTDKLIAQDVLVKKLSKKIKIYHNTGVKELVIKHIDKETSSIDRIVGVALKTGETVMCDGIFVAIGRVPNTALFKGQIDLDKGGFIITDRDMKTSASNIFAAGDVIQKSVKQAVTACGDGAVAATIATRK
jgi:thioredoxin reductase (NADPH)